MSQYYIANLILSYYSIVLTAVGTLGNLMSVGICTRKRLRQIPTFIFLSFMIVLDTISMYFWNLNNYNMTLFKKYPQDESVEKCKLVMFLQMFSLQASAFFLVTISVERFLSVRIKSWKTLFKWKHALLVSTMLVSVFFLMNLHLLFMIDFANTNNTAITGSCTASSGYKIWRPVHTYIYSLVPFLILVIVNLLLLQTVLKSKNKTGVINSKDKSKTKSMTISVIVLTVSFIFLTAPFAFAGGYYIGVLNYTESGRVILYSFVELAFTFHGSNFLILLVSNKQFKREFDNIWKSIVGQKSVPPPVTGNTNTTNNPRTTLKTDT